MRARTNIAGQRFGKLVASEMAGVDDNDNVVWHCICDCGGLSVVRMYSLRSGMTKSCGCAHRSRKGRNNLHGFGRTPTYQAWWYMIGGCEDENAPHYNKVGAKGISYPERWKDIRNFVKDMGEMPSRHSFRRRDKTKNYSKKNCYYKIMDW